MNCFHVHLLSYAALSAVVAYQKVDFVLPSYEHCYSLVIDFLDFPLQESDPCGAAGDPRPALDRIAPGIRKITFNQNACYFCSYEIFLYRFRLMCTLIASVLSLP